MLDIRKTLLVLHAVTLLAITEVNYGPETHLEANILSLVADSRNVEVNHN